MHTERNEIEYIEIKRSLLKSGFDNIKVQKHLKFSDPKDYIYFIKLIF